MAAGTAVALLGGGAQYTVKGGTGSGDVNERERVSILQGLQDAGLGISSLDWLRDSDRRYWDAREAWKRMILDAGGGAFRGVQRPPRRGMILDAGGGG